MGQSEPIAWTLSEFGRLREHAAALLSTHVIRPSLSLTSPSLARPYTPPRSFRVYAWRWHHIALERDLARLEKSLEQQAAVCGSCASDPDARHRRERLAKAFSFVVDANWQVHDWVEVKLFVPFVASICDSTGYSNSSSRDGTTVPGSVASSPWKRGTSSRSMCPSPASLTRIAWNRSQLAASRAKLRAEMERWVAVAPDRSTLARSSPTSTSPSALVTADAMAIPTGMSPGARFLPSDACTCARETKKVLSALSDLRTKAQQAFATSERALIPAVARNASAKAQEQFNRSVIKSLDGGRARVALVFFRDAVMSAPSTFLPTSFPVASAHLTGNSAVESRATRQDQLDFESSVPKAARLLIPMWRRQFVHKHLSVLDEL